MNIDYNIIRIVSIVLSVFISVMIAVFLLLLRKKNQDDILFETKEKILEDEKKISNPSVKKFSDHLETKHRLKYNTMKIYLSKIGANYMMKRVVDPAEYILARFLLTILIALTGLSMYGVIGLFLGGLLGYFFLPILLNVSNDRDNEMMIADIQSIYETLKIRTESGVFFTTSVQQCYKVVENSRLKEALAILGSELATTNDVKRSVDKFQMKFKNRYVDQLCVTIRQGYESGSTINCITDILNNLNGMQKALETTQKNKLDNEIMITQLLILVVILITILYVAFSSMTNFVI